jgi:hypothetical protein
MKNLIFFCCKGPDKEPHQTKTSEISFTDQRKLKNKGKTSEHLNVSSDGLKVNL